MATKKVRVENRARDIKHLGVAREDGTELVLGSSDDLGRRRDSDVELLAPVQEVSAEVWKEAMKRRAVQGWVDAGEITTS